jgi:thiosulfate/3-mercaptopyruvate sulfurtransferase
MKNPPSIKIHSCLIRLIIADICEILSAKLEGLSQSATIEIANSYIKIIKSGTGKFILTFFVIILYKYTSTSPSDNKKSKKGGCKMLQDFGRERMVRRKFLTILCALFLFSILFFSHQTAIAGMDAPALVETSWLADNLNKPGVKVVYVAFVDPNDKVNFDAKHISGSVYMDLGSLMGSLGDGSAAPDKGKFESVMGSLGISNDSHVVVYGSGVGNPFIATAFWLMKYQGHKNVSYLNGGFNKWAAEKRPTTAEATKITPTKYKASPDGSMWADANYVLQNIKNPKAVILDVRSSGEFKGTEDPTKQNKKLGRIPGAVNLDFFSSNFNNDGTFKSAGELKAAYEAKGVTKDKEIIVYCQGGARAAVSVLSLKYILGYPKVRNYVGSWGEWGNRLDTAKYPIEK